MNNLKSLIVPIVLLLAAACTASTAPEAGPEEFAQEKQEAAALGSADWGFDYCEAYGWYTDGVCDEFCPSPDPQCGSSECSTTDDCGTDEICDPGICLHHCLPEDPGCCAPGTCELLPETPECERDTDCAGGEICEPGICLLHCLPEDPGCCTPDTCQPVLVTPACEIDTDCASGEICEPGICLLHCLPEDPGCCAR